MKIDRRGVAFCIIMFLTICFVFLAYRYAVLVKKEQVQKVSYLFNQAVEREKVLMQPGQLFFATPKAYVQKSDSIIIETENGKVVYEKNRELDSLTLIHKREWNFQMYLAFKNPNRAFMLDSLFQDGLKRKGIIARTVVCFLQGDSLVNCSNDILCQSGMALEPVVFGVKHDSKRIELQAYILFSRSYLFSQMPLIRGIVLLWCISVILICVWFGRKKKEDMDIAVTNPLVQMSVVQHQPEVAEWEKLATDIFFNEKNGELKKKEHVIYLRKNRLLAFIKLLRAPDHFMNYDEICREVLERPLNDESSENSKKWNQAVKKSMGQTIIRLREDLSDFSEISIENVRDLGYQLNIK